MCPERRAASAGFFAVLFTAHAWAQPAPESTTPPQAPAGAPAESVAPAEPAAPAPAEPASFDAAASTGATTPETEATPSDAAASTEAAAPEAETAPAESDAAAETTEASEAAHGHGDGRYGGSPGIKLPADLSLHGRFDLVVQHDGYQDNPFDDGNERIRNHHHFVFLSRSSASDPFGLDVELVDLTFYEISFHHRPTDAPWRLSVRGGKLMVPFGPEPVFHMAYGGRIGFDQKLMPALWSRLGARVGFDYRIASLGVQLRNDLYAVQGYRLPQADAVLDLQADFDDAGFGFGDRIGIGWGALTAWYSLYANGLGFGRTLFMQAFDAEVYRHPELPVVDRFAVGLGAMRADISGGADEGYGGPGEDYYHFATYFVVKLFPLEWLYLQYRQGITNFDNRRGLWRDELRLDEGDNATHNLAAVARYEGLSATLSHAWNLEQRNEVDDDYLRLMVAYDF